MAGRGPAPKHPDKRVRRNSDPVPLRTVVIEPAVQPDLPEFEVEVHPKDGEPFMVPYEWPDATRGWWAMLAQHPSVFEFGETDWSYLLDTALIHAAFWKGDLKLAAELRLREAKYGFTPEDRMRLRWQTAQTVSAVVEAESKVERASSRDRLQGVKRLEA